MTESSVARRYAGALFSLSGKEGMEAMLERGRLLSELARLAREEPKLGAVLKSPVISAGEKKAILEAILEKLGDDRTTRNFCCLLADKERLASLGEIADWYSLMLDDARGILRGRVSTAVKLTPARQDEIKETLGKKFGKDIELTFRVDPEILGGMVLAVGDKVMDSSLRAQLGALRETLRRGI